jgi:hypothetical protein
MARLEDTSTKSEKEKGDEQGDSRGTSGVVKNEVVDNREENAGNIDDRKETENINSFGKGLKTPSSDIDPSLFRASGRSTRSRLSDPNFNPFSGEGSSKKKRKSTDPNWSPLPKKARVEEDDTEEDYSPNDVTRDDDSDESTDMLAELLPNVPDLLHLVIRVAREQPCEPEDRVIAIAQQRYEFELRRLQQERDAPTRRPDPTWSTPTRRRGTARRRSSGIGETTGITIYEDPVTESAPNEIVEPFIEDNDYENWPDFPAPTIR